MKHSVAYNMSHRSYNFRERKDEALGLYNMDNHGGCNALPLVQRHAGVRQIRAHPYCRLGKERHTVVRHTPLKTSGTYEQQLGLRVTGVYPFMGLTLIVNQSIFPKGKVQSMEKIEKSDTIQCDLIDKSGTTKGQGISYYQYNFPINAYRFASGDSIHITVKHNMKREILPGISDIGIKMSHIGE